MTRALHIALIAAALLVAGAVYSAPTVAEPTPPEPQIESPDVDLPDVSVDPGSSVESFVCPGAYDVDRSVVAGYDSAEETLNVTWSGTLRGWSDRIENRTKSRLAAINESKQEGTCGERYLPWA